MQKMLITVVTIFPEIFPGALAHGLSGKGLGKTWDLKTVNIRDFATDNHHTVDDTPYGGGAGMVMKPDVVHAAMEQALSFYDKHPKILFMTPRGRTFSHKIVHEIMEDIRPISKPTVSEEILGVYGPENRSVYEIHEDSRTGMTQKLPERGRLRDGPSGIIILCGRYEGIDQRVLDFWKKNHGMIDVSIGDFIVFGGELPAMVVIDACLRFVPGIMNNSESTVTESFSLDLLEYPQYTKPAVWMEENVPPVLLSGNHKEIAKWRTAQSEQITQDVRPDLWEKYTNI